MTCYPPSGVSSNVADTPDGSTAKNVPTGTFCVHVQSANHVSVEDLPKKCLEVYTQKHLLARFVQ